MLGWLIISRLGGTAPRLFLSFVGPADGRDVLQLADAFAGFHAQAGTGVLGEVEAAGGLGGVETDFDRG